MGSLAFQIENAQASEVIGSKGDPANPSRYVRVSLNTHKRLKLIKEDLSVSSFSHVSYNDVMAELLDNFDAMHHDYEKKPL